VVGCLADHQSRRRGTGQKGELAEAGISHAGRVPRRRTPSFVECGMAYWCVPPGSTDDRQLPRVVEV